MLFCANRAVDPSDRDARETKLLEALNHAWSEYTNAPPEEKPKAKARFQSLLEDFSAQVLRRGETDTPTSKS